MPHARRGCGARPRGRPPRWRRRGPAAAGAGPAPGPARAAAAARRESVVPRSPSRLSRPRGSAATKPSACAVRSAAQTSSSGTSSPSVTLPRTVSSNRNALCGTSAACAASCAGREVAKVDAVDADGAGVGVDQPGQQRGQGALAGRRRPDHRHRAPGLDGQVQVVEQQDCRPRRRSRGRRPRAGRSPDVRRRASRSDAVRRVADRVEHPLRPARSRPPSAGTRPASSRSTGSGRPRSSSR